MVHRTSDPIIDIPEGFRDIKCRNHPDREIVDPTADRFCQECHDKAWNAGARKASSEFKPSDVGTKGGDGWIYGGNANRE